MFRATYEEDLATSGVASTPPDEVVGNDKGLLGLASDVTGHHAQTQGLGRPEREGDVVADEETDVLGKGPVGDSHEENGADEGPAAVSIVH